MKTDFKEEDIQAAAAETNKYPNKFEATDIYDMALSERVNWALAKLRRKPHAGGGGGGGDGDGGGGDDGDDDDDDDDDMPSLELVDEGFSEETKNDALEVLKGIYGELIQENTLELILKGSGYDIENAVEVSHPHGI